MIDSSALRASFDVVPIGIGSNRGLDEYSLYTRLSMSVQSPKDATKITNT